MGRRLWEFETVRLCDRDESLAGYTTFAWVCALFESSLADGSACCRLLAPERSVRADLHPLHASSGSYVGTIESDTAKQGVLPKRKPSDLQRLMLGSVIRPECDS